MYTNPKAQSTCGTTYRAYAVKKEGRYGLGASVLHWGREDNCGGMEGEWDKGVRKGEKEIRVTVSTSGRDMRDVQSLYIHVE